MSKSSLLLLSQPPIDPSDHSISLAYRNSILDMITELKQRPFSTELLVAIHWPVLRGQLQIPRSKLHDEAQSIIRCLYRLIYIVCSDIGVEVDTCLPGSIDARLIFVDTTISDLSSHLDSKEHKMIAGPIVPLQSLTTRLWDHILSDEDEAKKLLAFYRCLTHQTSDQVNAPIDTIPLFQDYHPKCSSTTTSFSTHYVVAVGGTFDHLHAGHKLLLTATALLLQPPTNAQGTSKLIVGITGDELLKNKKYSEFLKSWEQRQEDVVDFLLSVMLFTHKTPQESVRTVSVTKSEPSGHIVRTILEPHSIIIECVEIQDPFGPTISDSSITALVVSGETRAGGQAINQKRAENGLSDLEVFEVDVLDLQESDEGTNVSNCFTTKMSSTEIRKRKAENVRRSLQ